MKKLDQFGCIVTVIKGKLHKCDMPPQGSPEVFAGSLTWTEVRGPVEQDFLDAVNQALKTNYKRKDFPESN